MNQLGIGEVAISKFAMLMSFQITRSEGEKKGLYNSDQILTAQISITDEKRANNELFERE